MKTRGLASWLLLHLLVNFSLAGERPNILFLFADDWGRHASAYARIDGAGTVNDAIATPHIDAVARSGVLFANAFVSAPSCTPCRSALVSGQHFWRTGRAAVLQGATWDDQIPSFPLLLEKNGYHIGHTFKVWSPGRPRDAPIGGQRTSYVQAGVRFNSFSQHVTRLAQDGNTVDQAKADLAAEVRENFRQFLKFRAEGQPFFYWFGPTNVHRKWIAGSGAALWGIRPDALQGKMPPFLPDVDVVREDLADYFGEIQAFDMAVGVLIKELRRLGVYDNTLIAISGDHGAPGFPHGKCNLYDFGTRVPLAVAGPGVVGGRVVNDLTSIPDLAPTFLDAAQVEPPKMMTARTLWPMLRSTDEGWIDDSRTSVFTGRERHVARARSGNLPYPQRAIRTRDYLLIINFRPDRFPLGDLYRLDRDSPPTREELTRNTFVTLPDEDAGPTKAWLVQHRDDPQWQALFDRAYRKRPRIELYDVRNDPHQMHNLANDAQFRNIAADLEQQLLDELQRTGDPRLVGAGEYFEEVDNFN